MHIYIRIYTHRKSITRINAAAIPAPKHGIY